VIVPSTSVDLNVVDSLSVIDGGGECCFLVKKNIDIVPIADTIINIANIIRVLAGILRRFG
jgi:hypothetical protein